MNLFHFILAVVATYGITTIITKYDGPGHIFLRLRERHSEFECYVCVSVWIGTLLCILYFMPNPIDWMTLFYAGAVVGMSLIVRGKLD